MLLEGILTLTAAGFQIEEIYDLPLDTFKMYVGAATRLEARRRLGYIADTTASIASVFSSKGAMKEYMSELEGAYLGDSDG